MKSRAEEEMALLLRANGIRYQREVRFHPTRRWRFDFVILPLERRIALEVEGGLYVSGRHTRGKGFEGDLEKYNQAVLAGWRVLRYSPKQITSAPEAILSLIGVKKEPLLKQMK